MKSIIIIHKFQFTVKQSFEEEKPLPVKEDLTQQYTAALKHHMETSRDRAEWAKLIPEKRKEKKYYELQMMADHTEVCSSGRTIDNYINIFTDSRTVHDD